MAEKSILLQVIDQQWKEHLLALDHLRQGINLRAYAQRDPLNEYKREAFNLFDEMLESVRHNVATDNALGAAVRPRSLRSMLLGGTAEQLEQGCGSREHDQVPHL